MSNEAQQMMTDYLTAHDHMTLATVTADGKPMAHTVSYASGGLTLYFMTDSKTRKLQNIQGCPDVAFTVEEQYKDFSKIQGIQMQARATVVTDPAEVEMIMGLMAAKFPMMQEMPKQEMDLRPVKVLPAKGWWIDNTKGFGNREWLEL